MHPTCKPSTLLLHPEVELAKHVRLVCVTYISFI